MGGTPFGGTASPRPRCIALQLSIPNYQLPSDRTTIILALFLTI
ncbi:hypothetical protein [Moorena producens]